MNLRLLLSAYGALSALGGALWIALPATLMGGFGAAALDPLAVYLTTLFGGAALGLGVMTWLARDAGPSPARNALVAGVTVTNLVWFMLTLMMALSGHLNALAWVPAGAYGVWTALFVVAGRDSMRAAKAAAAG